MTREIISEEDGFGIFVNTYWNGKEEGVQITTGKPNYCQMTREDARRFFLLAYNRLSRQILDDEENPPWWQGKSKVKSK